MTRPLISFRNLFLAFLLSLSGLGHASSVVTSTKIIDPFGQPFSGTLTLQLPFAGVLISGGQLVLPTPVSVTVTNGLIAAAFTVPGNDTMSPVMPYSATFTDPYGAPVTRQFYYIVGTTFDIGSAPAVPNFVNTNGFAGIGSCVNQVITAMNGGTPPTCASVSPAFTTGTTGSGSIFALQTSPVLVTPNIGAATGTSLTTTGQLQTNLGGGGTSSGVYVNASNPSYAWNQTGVAANNRLWDAVVDGSGALRFRTLDDPQTNSADWMKVTRSGFTITNVDFSGGPKVTSLRYMGADGLASSPSYSFVNAPTTGFYNTGSGNIFTSVQGVDLVAFAASLIRQSSSSLLGWTNGVVGSNLSDVNFTRLSPGVIQIGTGETANALGTLRAAKVGAIRWAENFNGADWVAKVNAADVDFGGLPGEIYVSQLAGTSASTALALTGGRRVRFVQGGIYTTSVGLNLGAGQCFIGSGEHSTSPGNEAVIKAANSSNLAFVMATGSGNACLEHITIDGNKANNPSGGVGLKIVDAGRFEASDVTVQNSPTHGVWIFSTGNGDLSCCAKFKRMFIFQNNGNGFYGQNTADVFVSGQTEVENNGVDAVVNCATTTCTFVSGTVWSNNTASLAGTHALVNGSTLTVSSVTSTTMVFTTTVGTLTGVHLYSGGGYELSDSPTWRIEGTDTGGNALGGILVVGTDAGIHSDEEIITGNQFGNNLGPDISTFGFGSSGYVGTGHSMYGNTFIGCGGVGTCQSNTFPMIAMNDDKNSSIIGNVFDNHATIKKSYGIQITEGAANRNLGTRIGPNTYGVGASALGTANTNCTTSSSGGMCAMDSTRATIILCPSQGQAGPVTGTAGDAPIFSCTIPAWTLGLIRSIRVHVGWNHTTGTATVTYKGFYGANSAQIASSTLAGEASGIFYVQASAATNVQTIITDPFYNGATIVGGISRTGIATDSTTAQTLKVTFNVAATDQVTPTEFWAELIY